MKKPNKKSRAGFDTERNQAKLEKEFITSGYTNKEEYVKDVKKLYDKGLTMKQATNRVKLNKSQLTYIDDKKVRNWLKRKEVQDKIKGISSNAAGYDPIKAAALNIKEQMKREKLTSKQAIEKFRRSVGFGTGSYDRHRMNVQYIVKKAENVNVDYKSIQYQDGVYYLPDGTTVEFKTPSDDSHAHVYINGIDKGLAIEYGIYA